MNILGLDIGASKVLAVVFDIKKKRILFQKSYFYSKKTKPELLKILRTIAADTASYHVSKIGVGIAGQIQKGVLTAASPNFPALKNWPAKKDLQRIFKKPVVLDNDARVFALAETVLGAAKNYRIVFGLTIGSGLGGGLVIDKKIYRGQGAAGEIGRMLIECKMQNAKCKIIEAEDLVSEKFFRKLGITDTRKLGQQAKSGDRQAKKVLERFGENLGFVLVNIINILNPEIIVFGGGLGELSAYFLPATKRVIKKYAFVPAARNTLIKKARLGQAAGAIGAALL